MGAWVNQCYHQQMPISFKCWTCIGLYLISFLSWSTVFIHAFSADSWTHETIGHKLYCMFPRQKIFHNIATEAFREQRSLLLGDRSISSITFHSGHLHPIIGPVCAVLMLFVTSTLAVMALYRFLCNLPGPQASMSKETVTMVMIMGGLL